ncbi:MAG: polyprenyl diphosphate synthase [Oscillospiraceae bacterium]|nr:polyprenyl diphosphate synthase [Oscillospiraceae bacterium]
MRLFRKSKSAGEPDLSKLPRHIAIIMDGNGRWAKRRGLPRTAGHAAGAENFRAIATHCKNIGIEYLTVYAFSTENWKRPPDEVATIMGLLEKYLREAIAQMERDRVKLKFFGDTSVLSEDLRTLIAETEAISKRFEGVQVNICLNYGGRDEILRATEAYAEAYKNGTAPPLTAESFSTYLYSANIPDPDLVIRPSGEMRLSNFLLWQSAYSEFYFTKTLWPNFNPHELDKAIIAFQERDRRYGGI